MKYNKIIKYLLNNEHIIKKDIIISPYCVCYITNFGRIICYDYEFIKTMKMVECNNSINLTTQQIKKIVDHTFESNHYFYLRYEIIDLLKN